MFGIKHIYITLISGACVLLSACAAKSPFENFPEHTACVTRGNSYTRVFQNNAPALHPTPAVAFFYTAANAASCALFEKIHAVYQTRPLSGALTEQEFTVYRYAPETAPGDKIDSSSLRTVVVYTFDSADAAAQALADFRTQNEPPHLNGRLLHEADSRAVGSSFFTPDHTFQFSISTYKKHLILADAPPQEVLDYFERADVNRVPLRSTAAHAQTFYLNFHDFLAVEGLPQHLLQTADALFDLKNMHINGTLRPDGLCLEITAPKGFNPLVYALFNSPEPLDFPSVFLAQNEPYFAGCVNLPAVADALQNAPAPLARRLYNAFEGEIVLNSINYASAQECLQHLRGDFFVVPTTPAAIAAHGDDVPSFELVIQAFAAALTRCSLPGFQLDMTDAAAQDNALYSHARLMPDAAHPAHVFDTAALRGARFIYASPTVFMRMDTDNVNAIPIIRITITYKETSTL